MQSESIWNDEYCDAQAIPSSTRVDPSRAFRQFVPLLNPDLDLVADVGCGNGRNAVYAAERFGARTVGVDFSTEALETANEWAVDRGVDLLRANAVGDLPFPDGEVDLLIDSYVSCHFIEEQTWESYVSEIDRVVDDSDGFLYWCGMSVEDEYYSVEGEREDEMVVTDPRNNITKRLYSRQEMEELFPGFTPVVVSDVGFTDSVADTEWDRRVLAGLYRRE